MTQDNTTTEDFINQGIASGNLGMMKGIAETVTDLSDDQIKALLFSGSLEITKAMILNLKAGSTIFTDIAKRAISLEEEANGVTGTVIDETTGSIADTFFIVRDVCGAPTPEAQDASLRYAKDNIARIILGLNLDGLDLNAVTVDDIVMELDKSILSNQNAPEEIVTPFLTSPSDVLKAKAFVHANTDNDAIVAAMKADDDAATNIDGFKLAMIKDLNTDTMIQSNANIVAYLLGDNQSTPVGFAMFKNYLNVVLNGGSTIPGINIDALIAKFVG